MATRTLTIAAQDLRTQDRVTFTDTSSGVGAPRRLRRGTVTRITPGRITVICDDGSRGHLHPDRAQARHLRIEADQITDAPADIGAANRLLKGHPAARAMGHLLRTIGQAQTESDSRRVREATRTVYQELLETFSNPNRMARLSVTQMVDSYLLHEHGLSAMFEHSTLTRDIAREVAPPSQPTDTWQITDRRGAVLGRVTCASEELLAQAVVAKFGQKALRGGYGRRRLSVDELD